MKVYLYIAKQKKTLKMYLPYIEALGKKLDITHNLADADIVMILGAWTMQGAQLAGNHARWAFHTWCVHSETSLNETGRILTSSAASSRSCIRRRCIKS